MIFWNSQTCTLSSKVQNRKPRNSLYPQHSLPRSSCSWCPLLIQIPYLQLTDSENLIIISNIYTPVGHNQCNYIILTNVFSHLQVISSGLTSTSCMLKLNYHIGQDQLINQNLNTTSYGYNSRQSQ
jgi:hypothetical protein